jgi:hypothetical protein
MDEVAGYLADGVSADYPSIWQRTLPFFAKVFDRYANCSTKESLPK